MNWNSLTLDEFQSSLASKSATPGGTASAVALGQSAALVAMVFASLWGMKNGKMVGTIVNLH